MKYAIFVLAVLISACSPKTPESTSSSVNRLHDIWALKVINGAPYKRQAGKQPVLEIFVKDKRIIGNDGCNNISGPLKTLNDTQIIFGRMMGTKMACPDMQLSNAYNKAMSQVVKYNLKGLKLSLMDDKGTTLLEYIKVD